MFKKILLGLASFQLSASAIPTFSSNNSENNELLQFLVNDIKQNSTFSNQETEYIYKNKNYSSFDQILNNELKDNPIEKELTISDPGKIIKNYSNGELDSDQIYNGDKNNLVKIYKSALGNVLLPNCKKDETQGCYDADKFNDKRSTEERALDSYYNKGLTRPVYSYDSINWFDSTEEAKIDFKKNNFKIKKSLFYTYNGYYYNAFNKQDLELLKNQLTPGYTFDGYGNKELIDKEKGIEEYSNDINTFENGFKKKLYKYLDNNEYIDTDFGFDLVFRTDGNQWFNILNDNKKIASLTNNNKTLRIHFNNDLRKEFIATDIINNMKNESLWSSNMDSGWGSGHWNDWKETHTIELFDNYLKIKLDTNRDDNWDAGYNHTYIDKIKFDIDNSNLDNSFLWKTNENNLFYKLLKEKFNNDFIEIDNNKLSKTFKKQLNILNIYDYSNMTYKSLNFEKKNLIFELYFEWLKNIIFDDNFINKNLSPVKRNWFYGKHNGIKEGGWQFDFISRNKKMKETITKKLAEFDNKKEVAIDIADTKFTTTVENWRENFYYFENDGNNNGIKLSEYYYVDNGDNKDISAFSDLEKENIAPNINKAEEIAFQNKMQILRKGYNVYDIYGNSFFTRSAEKEITQEIKRRYLINFRFTSKDEVKKLIDNSSEWSNLVSSKFSTVYKFLDNNKYKYKYFASYNDALESYKNYIPFINEIQQKILVYYVYTISIKDKIYSFKYEKNDNILEIANKIIKQL